MSPRISSLSFLTPGNYLDHAPGEGLEETLRLFGFGERLGYQGAWVRQRHLEHGVSSAAVFLAAAGQRTTTIELGTAVIPMGYESPFRLGEDLATADVLSGGRLQVGLSAGTPPHAGLMAHLVHDGDWRSLDLSHRRIERLIHHLGPHWIGDEDTVIHSPGSVQRPRLQPYSPGLVRRIWLGAGSVRSVRWAGDHGVNLLLGNVSSGEGTDDFTTSRVRQLAAYAEALSGRPARIAVGRVIVPTDSADAVTRRRYAAFAASRHERTLMPHGERRTLFAPDLVGTAEEIVERLLGDPVLDGIAELRLELPYEFDREDYEQILTDAVEHVAPALGWTPAQPPVVVANRQ